MSEIVILINIFINESIILVIFHQWKDHFSYSQVFYYSHPPPPQNPNISFGMEGVAV